MPRVLFVLVFVLLAGAASAERRVALVIGEDDYRTIRKLDNAVDDAQGDRRRRSKTSASR